MIELKQLTKYYGRTPGIINVNLEVDKGEVFGFLGPNGAGKTTTIRLLLDLIRPTAGNVLVMGMDVNRDSREVRKHISYLPAGFTAYDHLNGESYINFVSGFYEDPKARNRAFELASHLDLNLKRRLSEASSGMKQKLGIIQTFMVDTPVYILDEPTSGLDPFVQRLFYALVKEQRDVGKTIFFSSHILPEIERVCDRVGIIRKGELVTVDAVQELRRKKMKEVEVVYVNEQSPAFFERDGIEVVASQGRKYSLRITSEIGKAIHYLCSVPLEDIQVHDPSLEEVFLSFYGEVEENSDDALD